jgi:hypothetical protein
MYVRASSDILRAATICSAEVPLQKLLGGAVVLGQIEQSRVDSAAACCRLEKLGITRRRTSKAAKNNLNCPAAFHDRVLERRRRKSIRRPIASMFFFHGVVSARRAWATW